MVITKPFQYNNNVNNIYNPYSCHLRHDQQHSCNTLASLETSYFPGISAENRSSLKNLIVQKSVMPAQLRYASCHDKDIPIYREILDEDSCCTNSRTDLKTLPNNLRQSNRIKTRPGTPLFDDENDHFENSRRFMVYDKKGCNVTAGTINENNCTNRKSGEVNGLTILNSNHLEGFPDQKDNSNEKNTSTKMMEQRWKDKKNLHVIYRSNHNVHIQSSSPSSGNPYNRNISNNNTKIGYNNGREHRPNGEIPTDIDNNRDGGDEEYEKFVLPIESVYEMIPDCRDIAIDLDGKTPTAAGHEINGPKDATAVKEESYYYYIDRQKPPKAPSSQSSPHQNLIATITAAVGSENSVGCVTTPTVHTKTEWYKDMFRNLNPPKINQINEILGTSNNRNNDNVIHNQQRRFQSKKDEKYLSDGEYLNRKSGYLNHLRNDNSYKERQSGPADGELSRPLYRRYYGNQEDSHRNHLNNHVPYSYLSSTNTTYDPGQKFVSHESNINGYQQPAGYLDEYSRESETLRYHKLPVPTKSYAFRGEPERFAFTIPGGGGNKAESICHEFDESPYFVDVNNNNQYYHHQKHEYPTHYKSDINKITKDNSYIPSHPIHSNHKDDDNISAAHTSNYSYGNNSISSTQGYSGGITNQTQLSGTPNISKSFSTMNLLKNSPSKDNHYLRNLSPSPIIMRDENNSVGVTLTRDGRNFNTVSGPSTTNTTLNKNVHQWYVDVQKGGDIPYAGLQKIHKDPRPFVKKDDGFLPKNVDYTKPPCPGRGESSNAITAKYIESHQDQGIRSSYLNHNNYNQTGTSSTTKSSSTDYNFFDGQDTIRTRGEHFSNDLSNDRKHKNSANPTRNIEISRSPQLQQHSSPRAMSEVNRLKKLDFLRQQRSHNASNKRQPVAGLLSPPASPSKDILKSIRDRNLYPYLSHEDNNHLVLSSPPRMASLSLNSSPYHQNNYIAQDKSNSSGIRNLAMKSPPFSLPTKTSTVPYYKNYGRNSSMADYRRFANDDMRENLDERLHRNKMDEWIEREKLRKSKEELKKSVERRHGYVPSTNSPIPVNRYMNLVYENDGGDDEEINFHRTGFLGLRKNMPPTTTSRTLSPFVFQSQAGDDFEDDPKRHGSQSALLGNINRGVKDYFYFPRPGEGSERDCKMTRNLRNKKRMICPKARVLYRFTPKNDREIPLETNEIVYLHRRIDSNWYEGEYDNFIGIFPANYVKVLISIEEAALLNAEPGEGVAIAYYNYNTPEEFDGLTFKKGDVIFLTEEFLTNPREFRVCLEGKTGTVPDKYLDVLRRPLKKTHRTNVVSTMTSNQLQNHNNTFDLSSTTFKNNVRPSSPDPTEDKLIRYKAMYSYKPHKGDEMELREGDIVYVKEKCDDGWYVGYHDQTKFFGTFPGNYVEYFPVVYKNYDNLILHNKKYFKFCLKGRSD